MGSAGLENVWPIALVMCVAFWAATIASELGTAASSGAAMR